MKEIFKLHISLPLRVAVLSMKYEYKKTKGKSIQADHNSGTSIRRGGISRINERNISNPDGKLLS